MALNLDLLLKSYGANSPEYIAEYAIVNMITEAEATTEIESDPAQMPSYIEKYGRKWSTSMESWEKHHVQKVYGETRNSSPYDNRVVTYDYDGVLCDLSETQSTYILKTVARVIRERTIAEYGASNVVRL